MPSHKTLFIPNVTTDVGLSPPYNSLFTLLRPVLRPRRRPDRQERRHGLRAAQGRRPAGRSARTASPATATSCRRTSAFMVLTRAQNQPGPDGVLGTADDIQDANNTDSPVGRPEPDLHLARLAPGLPARVRDERRRPAGRHRQAARRPAPAPTAGGMATWARKTQAARPARPAARDTDVAQHPDAGRRPLRQVPAGSGPRPAAVRDHDRPGRGQHRRPRSPVPANVVHFDTPFLTDIAHNADPVRRTPTTTRPRRR